MERFDNLGKYVIKTTITPGRRQLDIYKDTVHAASILYVYTGNQVLISSVKISEPFKDKKHETRH